MLQVLFKFLLLASVLAAIERSLEVSNESQIRHLLPFAVAALRCASPHPHSSLPAPLHLCASAPLRLRASAPRGMRDCVRALTPPNKQSSTSNLPAFTATVTLRTESKLYVYKKLKKKVSPLTFDDLSQTVLAPPRCTPTVPKTPCRHHLPTTSHKPPCHHAFPLTSHPP